MSKTKTTNTHVTVEKELGMDFEDFMYSMHNQDIKSIIGRKVLEARINEEKNYVYLLTDKGPVHLTWVGECCASCYIAHVEGSDYLSGTTIISVENAEWTRKDTDGKTIVSMGTNIKTNKGHISIETRLEHNVYYRGEINVSYSLPIGQYSSPRHIDQIELDKELIEMSPLTDF